MPLSFLHIVQPVFHIGRKFNVYDIIKPFHHQAVDNLAQGRGRQTLVLFDHIVPVLNGRDDGSIRGRTSHAFLLHGLDQHRLGVPGRRLGEMLLLIHTPDGRLIPLLQVRQGRTGSLHLLILPLFVHGNKAGKLQALMRRFKQMPAALRVNRHGVINGIGHLRGQKTAPNQLVQPVLVPA